MNLIMTSGKRKNAIARAILIDGTGVVRINNMLLDTYEPAISRLRVQEPIVLLGDMSKINIRVKVTGGGQVSQAEAMRLAVARALVKYDKKLEKVFLEYDRHLLVADVRRKETHKPNRHGKARAKRQKSYR